MSAMFATPAGVLTCSLRCVCGGWGHVGGAMCGGWGHVGGAMCGGWGQGQPCLVGRYIAHGPLHSTLRPVC